MQEEWKLISEPELIENAYMISSKGRIKLLERTIYTGEYKAKRVIKEKIMRPSLTAKKYNTYGYYSQPLRRKDGKQKTYFIHRLVAKYFLPNWDSNLTVNHIDENSLNNHVTNLEMVSMKDNINYGTRCKRAKATYNLRSDRRNIKPLILEKDGEVLYMKSISKTAEYLKCGKARVRSCLKGQREHISGWKITEQ